MYINNTGIRFYFDVYNFILLINFTLKSFCKFVHSKNSSNKF